MNILTEIVQKRRKLIRDKGYELGVSVPEKRKVPVQPFIRDPFLVCEVKRKSPSKGNISIHLDARKQAELYYSRGIRSVSVLTEPNYFAGSISDMLDVKQEYPDLSVLRKDFLLSIEDIEVSYRAGADAVLLIASILSGDELKTMYTRTKELGMEALVEVHNRQDIEKVKHIKPVLTGINSRDLTKFSVDLTLPIRMKQMIDWDTHLLFESGIHFQENALVALSSGFKGILVGEAVVRDPSLIQRLKSAFSLKRGDFWERLYKRDTPFVKICGITNTEDAYHAMESGADILGFIFAPSKRQAKTSLLSELKDCPILKVGVVVTNPGQKALEPEIRNLLEHGLIDAIQFHGNEKPEDCYPMAFPYYKALRIRDKHDISSIKTYRSPRVLVDAFSENLQGGTGKSIPGGLVLSIKDQVPLWLAGGMGPDNIASIIKRFSPELIDASSRLEESPGKKNHEFVEKFMTIIKARKNNGV